MLDPRIGTYLGSLLPEADPVRAAMEKLGVLPIHRRSFGPVRKALGLDPVQEELALE